MAMKAYSHCFDHPLLEDPLSTMKKERSLSEDHEMNRLSAASRPVSAWISFFVVGEGIFKIV